jgi:hypothetical protein
MVIVQASTRGLLHVLLQIGQKAAFISGRILACVKIEHSIDNQKDYANAFCRLFSEYVTLENMASMRIIR